jgi:hypothetical protein
MLLYNKRILQEERDDRCLMLKERRPTAPHVSGVSSGRKEDGTVSIVGQRRRR